jgi:hypothetical protein
MQMLASTDGEITGEVVYLDPSQEWGYLHGPLGERVYFHASDVLGSPGELRPGTPVRYIPAIGVDQPCAAMVVRCPGRRR